MKLNMNDLPDNILLNIFSHLEKLVHYLTIMWVCKRWHSLAFDRKLWTEFDDSDFYGFLGNCPDSLLLNRSTTINILKKTQGYLKRIKVYEHEMNGILGKYDIKFPNLEEIIICSNLDVYDIDDIVHAIDPPDSARVYFHDVLLKCPKSIRIVMIDGYGGGRLDPIQKPTTDWEDIGIRMQSNIDRDSVSFGCDELTVPKKIFQILSQMPRLKELQISNSCIKESLQCSEDTIKSLFNKLLVVNLFPVFSSEKSINRIISNLDLVRFVKLTSCPASCLGNIASSCLNLTELHLSQISEPQEQTPLSEIVKKCTKLKRFSLTSVLGAIHKCLLSLSQYCANIQAVNVHKCYYTEPAQHLECVNEILAKCRNIKDINVIETYSINPLSEDNETQPSSLEDSIRKEVQEIKSVNIESCSFFTPATLETLMKQNLKCLVELQLVDVKPMDLQVLEELTGSCCNLRKFQYSEIQWPVEKEYEGRQNQVLGTVCCNGLHSLKLSFCCGPIPIEQIVQLIQRNPWLGIMHFQPATSSEIHHLPNKLTEFLGDTPHALDTDGTGTYDKDQFKLEMVSQKIWRLMTIPQWGGVWDKFKHDPSANIF